MDPDSARLHRLDRLTQDLNEVLSTEGQDLSPSLAPEVYAELRRVAARSLRNERLHHTLQTTALVHEAYVRLTHGDVKIESRAHFFRLAARTMRNLLINHARDRKAKKREGHRRRLSLTDVTLIAEASAVDVLALNEILKDLEQMSPRKSQIVELRFFGGCTVEETAEALGVSPATVEREWRFTRAWLVSRLEED